MMQGHICIKPKGPDTTDSIWFRERKAEHVSSKQDGLPIDATRVVLLVRADK